jgi:plasmid stabilization system protein ParE
VIPVAQLPEAAIDIRRAAEFYARESRGLGAEFLREFESVTKLLLENPEIGVLTRGGARKLVMRRFPYLIIYRVEPERVLVLAVGHQRRRPDIWVKRV